MRRTFSKNSRRKANRQQNGKFRFDPGALIKAARAAVREALLRHKRAGNPVSGVKNGRVVLIPPDQIKV